MSLIFIKSVFIYGAFFLFLLAAQMASWDDSPQYLRTHKGLWFLTNQVNKVNNRRLIITSTDDSQFS